LRAITFWFDLRLGLERGWRKEEAGVRGQLLWFRKKIEYLYIFFLSVG